MANRSARQSGSLTALRDARQAALQAGSLTPTYEPRDDHRDSNRGEQRPGRRDRSAGFDPLIEIFERGQRESERMVQEFRQRRRELDQESAPSFAKCLFWALVSHFIGRLLILGLISFVTVELPPYVDSLRTIIHLVVSFLWTNVAPILCFVGGMVLGYGQEWLSQRLTSTTGGTAVGATME